MRTVLFATHVQTQCRSEGAFKVLSQNFRRNLGGKQCGLTCTPILVDFCSCSVVVDLCRSPPIALQFAVPKMGTDSREIVRYGQFLLSLQSADSSFC